VAALGDWRRYRELIFLAATALVAFGFLWLKHALREREEVPEEAAEAEPEAGVEPETEPPSST